MMTTATELLVRTLCDSQPSAPAAGAYLCCATQDNQLSVFRAAKKIVTHHLAEQILILQAAPLGGYPGGRQWRDDLEALGIPTARICGVPAGDATSINTLIESQALVRHAKEQEMDSLLVVAPPFQQFRAFVTAVSVALAAYPKLKVYSCPGTTLPWLDTVVHSQGTLEAPRRQLIQEELVRIETYQNKGDLASFETVLSYINQRDG